MIKKSNHASNNTVKEILDTLGLKHVISLDLHFVDDVATATVQYYPTDDEMKLLPPILKKFELTEIE